MFKLVNTPAYLMCINLLELRDVMGDCFHEVMSKSIHGKNINIGADNAIHLLVAKGKNSGMVLM